MRIDQTNYESFLLSYIDGELMETEKREVEAFCAGNPEAARELGLLQLTVMIPTLTVFENKASLYREEEKRHVIGWYFWRAAAVIIVLAGIGFLYWTLKPESGSKNDREKMAAVKPPEPEKTMGRSDTVTIISGSTASLAAGKTGVAANKHVKRSAETGNRAGKTTNTSVVQEKNSDPAGGNTPASPEEEEFPVVAARKNQLDIAAVRTPVNLTGNPITIPLNKNDRAAIAVSPGNTMPGNQVAVIDGPADAETNATAGDDAVSVLHLAKSSSVVGKLFHRLTGGKNNNDQPENVGDKKVNISIFQFAVGK